RPRGLGRNHSRILQRPLLRFGWDGLGKRISNQPAAGQQDQPHGYVDRAPFPATRGWSGKRLLPDLDDGSICCGRLIDALEIRPVGTGPDVNSDAALDAIGLVITL